MCSGGGDEEQTVIGGGGAELNRQGEAGDQRVGLAGAEEDQVRGVDVFLRDLVVGFDRQG